MLDGISIGQILGYIVGGVVASYIVYHIGKFLLSSIKKMRSKINH